MIVKFAGPPVLRPLAIVVPVVERLPLVQLEVPETVVHVAVATIADTGTVEQFVKLAGALTATVQLLVPFARVNLRLALADPATVAFVSGSGAVKVMLGGVTLGAETVIG